MNRVRLCPTGKRMFYGQAAADSAIEKIASLDGPRRSYRCDKCDTWHITRETGAQRRHRADWQTKRAESMRPRGNR